MKKIAPKRPYRFQSEEDNQAIATIWPSASRMVWGESMLLVVHASQRRRVWLEDLWVVICMQESRAFTYKGGESSESSGERPMAESHQCLTRFHQWYMLGVAVAQTLRRSMLSSLSLSLSLSLYLSSNPSGQCPGTIPLDPSQGHQEHKHLLVGFLLLWQ